MKARRAEHETVGRKKRGKSGVDRRPPRGRVSARRGQSARGRVNMPHPNQKLRMSDEEFANEFEHHGATRMAKDYDVDVRRIFRRRELVEKALGRRLVPPAGGEQRSEETIRLETPVASLDIRDGCVLVGGDGHYWPGVESTAHRAFVEFTSRLQPKAVIFNGDALDAPSISRHPPIGWEDFPTLEDELIECQQKLGEIVKAGPKRCVYYWPLGNHDARFNTRLASVTPEFRNVPGTRLVHHFPDWRPCWAVELGGRDGAVVKHRFRSGMHAPHNNALWAGRSMVTGHLHSQKVTPITDYNGTRYGVDTGMLAPASGRQFNYNEANPRNWRSGFCVLSWWKGALLPPELVSVLDEEKGLVVFRGDVMKV